MKRTLLPQGESSSDVGHNTETGLWPPFLPETPLQEAENSMRGLGDHSSMTHSELALQIMNYTLSLEL